YHPRRLRDARADPEGQRPLVLWHHWEPRPRTGRPPSLLTPRPAHGVHARFHPVVRRHGRPGTTLSVPLAAAPAARPAAAGELPRGGDRPHPARRRRLPRLAARAHRRGRRLLRG